jgi:lipid II:glycine glycyltransferase (peptidoglycan interpeptide bridge formation enzyme)
MVNGLFGRRRLVSLPFSDHCAPLVEGPEQLHCLLAGLQQRIDRRDWNSMEVRANEAVPVEDQPENEDLVLHHLDLQPSLQQLFDGLHPSCTQRKIKRAAREELSYEEGTSESLLHDFYRLLVITRRRHGVPPQPFQWFLNLAAHLKDSMKLRAAYKDGKPIASILTLRYKQTMMYKYGCLDDRFSAMGGTQFLFWHTIQEAKSAGLSFLDLGRTDVANAGLLKFKDRWGAARTNLHYYQYPVGTANTVKVIQTNLVKALCSHLPVGVLEVAGKVLYKYAH